MNPKKVDVLAIGELNVDLILNKIDGFPKPGKEIMAGSMVLTLGSSTAIFAANLAKLGTKVGFLGKIGYDTFGDLVEHSLVEKGIDTSYLIREKNISTGATIALNYGEERAMVTFPGAMEYLSINDITDDLLNTARHIHFSSFFFQPGIRNEIHTLFTRAKKLGLSTSLDVQWDPSEKWDFDYKNILPHVDIFLPNEVEFKNIARADNLREAISKLSPYLNHVVIKRGVNGSIMKLATGEIAERPAYLNRQVVDAIGAGDSFNAGFIHYFLQGYGFLECQDFGSLTGAVSTYSAGGTTAFKDMEKVWKLIEDLKNK